MKTVVQKRDVFFGVGSRAETAPDAPTIVFIHGAGFDHSVWVMPARYFARHGLRVLVPDLPGHGGSAGPPLRNIEAMADWLAEFLELNEVAGTTAVGHSMGSLVVAALAVRHPGLVERLALLGTSNPMRVGPPLLDAAADDHPAAFAMANTWSHSSKGYRGGAAVPGQSNFVSGARWLERMPAGVYHADLNACNSFQLALEDITQPTLVIAGEADKMTPLRAAHEVAERIPNASLVTLAGCGHAMLSEQPNQVLDALAEFTQGEN